MTVSSTANRVSYNCGGSQTAFVYNFKIFQDSDLKVILTDSGGNETTLTLNSDYTVSGAGNESGGSITTTQAYASGNRITIIRELPLKQETNYEEGGSFPAESHENALDKLTMICQQLGEAIGRAIKLPQSSAYSDLQIPDPEANKALIWNAAGTALINAVVSSVIGASTDLTDFPSSLTALKGLRRNSGNTAWELVDLLTLPSYPGARLPLRINASNNGIEGTLQSGLFKAVSKTANYTMTADDCFVAVDASSGNVTITLEPAASRSGLQIVTKTDTSSNYVEVIRGSGVGSFDDGTSQIRLYSKGHTMMIFTDGSTNNYYTVGFSDNNKSLVRICANTTGTSVPNAATTTVNFDYATFDLRSEADLANNRIVIRETGYYQVNAKVMWGSFPASSTAQLMVQVDGTTRIHDWNARNGAMHMSNSCSDIIYIGAGSYITCVVSQDSGSSQNISAGSQYTYLSVTKLSQYPLVY
jgi:hypothetical protein